jgi:hypothetical protein
MKSLFTAALVSLILGCREQSRPPAPFAAPEAFKATLVRVLDKYVIVQGGLVTGNQTLAKNALSAMHGELHALSADGLDSAAKAYFDSTDMGIMGVLHDTAFANGDIEVARRLFREFTPYLSDLLIRFGVTEELPVYVLRCAEAGSGEWLQKDSSVTASPYPGASGPGCTAAARRLGS